MYQFINSALFLTTKQNVTVSELNTTEAENDPTTIFSTATSSNENSAIVKSKGTEDKSIPTTQNVTFTKNKTTVIKNVSTTFVSKNNQNDTITTVKTTKSQLF